MLIFGPAIFCFLLVIFVVDEEADISRLCLAMYLIFQSQRRGVLPSPAGWLGLQHLFLEQTH